MGQGNGQVFGEIGVGQVLCPVVDNAETTDTKGCAKVLNFWQWGMLWVVEHHVAEHSLDGLSRGVQQVIRKV